jgi:heme o synthase
VAAICLGSIFKLNLVLKTAEEKYFNKDPHSFMSDIFELTKPRLSALVVSTALVGILLAPGQLNFFQGLLSLVLIGMVVIGGCALNCYIEIDVDSLMERTKVRSLPSGRLNANWALGFGIVMLVIALPALFILVNPLTSILSALAAIFYLFLYTPMKIKSPYAVIVGAIPGAIPPMLGWTTVTGKLDFDVWSLFLILFFWQIPHFLAISIFNAKDYKAAKIKVFPNIIGFLQTRNSIVMLTFVMLFIAVLPHLIGSASTVFLFASLGLSTLMIVLSLFGFKHSSEGGALTLWSKRYFWGTIIYLPMLLGAMIFLK